MNLAVSVGTMLLGGWVLPSVDSPTDQGELTPLPPVSRPEYTPRPVGGPTDPLPGYRYGTRQPRSASGEAQMPVPPTDPGLSSPDSPLAAPTESSGYSLPGFGTRTLPRGGVRPGASATQPRQSAASRPSGEMGAHQGRTPPSVGGSTVGTGKAYAGYTPPPTVSPYMNLFRTNTGGVDNYTTLVRPQLEQQRANRVIGGEIRGLQSNARAQQSALMRLHKAPGNPAATTTAPEFFMNHSNYFPQLTR